MPDANGGQDGAGSVENDVDNNTSMAAPVCDS
jgi:hypothetical protein